MRILLVVDLYGDAGGGTGAHVRHLATWLGEAGHEVAVVTAGLPSKAEIVTENITVFRTRLSAQRIPGLNEDESRPFAPPTADPHFVRAIRAVIRDFKPHVVHAHGWSEASAQAALWRTKIPLVVTLHDYGLICPKKSLLRGTTVCETGAGTRCYSCPVSEQSPPKLLVMAGALKALSLCRSERTTYIAVSSAVKDYHLRFSNIRSIKVIPNFIDSAPLAPSPLPDSPTLLYVGAEAVHKGYEVLLAAFEQVRLEVPKLRLVHVGGMEVSESPQFERLGKVDSSEMAEVYKVASIVVAPALYPDPCPTVLLEGMSFGRAVIASRIGGHLDIVGTDTGVLVRPRDVGELVSVIRTLAASPDLVRRLGKAAHARVGETFTADAVGPAIVRAYGDAEAGG